MWGSIFQNRRILIFVDNDASRFGLIKAESNSLVSQKIIKQYYRLECLSPSVTWFARVPSESNPADPPSRGELVQAAKLFNAEIVELKNFESEVVKSLMS